MIWIMVCVLDQGIIISGYLVHGKAPSRLGMWAFTFPCENCFLNNSSKHVFACLPYGAAYMSGQVTKCAFTTWVPCFRDYPAVTSARGSCSSSANTS